MSKAISPSPPIIADANNKRVSCLVKPGAIKNFLFLNPPRCQYSQIIVKKYPNPCHPEQEMKRGLKLVAPISEIYTGSAFGPCMNQYIGCPCAPQQINIVISIPYHGTKATIGRINHQFLGILDDLFFIKLIDSYESYILFDCLLYPCDTDWIALGKQNNSSKLKGCKFNCPTMINITRRQQQKKKKVKGNSIELAVS